MKFKPLKRRYAIANVTTLSEIASDLKLKGSSTHCPSWTDYSRIVTTSCKICGELFPRTDRLCGMFYKPCPCSCYSSEYLYTRIMEILEWNLEYITFREWKE